MARKLIPYSDSEIVIEYISPYSKGTMIIDVNYYNAFHKQIVKKLKDCEIISFIERTKG